MPERREKKLTIIFTFCRVTQLGRDAVGIKRLS